MSPIGFKIQTDDALTSAVSLHLALAISLHGFHWMSTAPFWHFFGYLFSRSVENGALNINK